jgi:anaerobic selenocysteine-containing dehydrogenase
MAVLETKRGGIEIRVKATEDIMPGVVCIPHGWAKGNANVLTDDRLICKESGYPNMHALLCRMSPSG